MKAGLASPIARTNGPAKTFLARVRTKTSRGLVSLWCALVLSCFLAQTAKADFITPYALSDFTLSNTNADGTASTPDSGLSLNLVGGNNGTGEPGTTDFVAIAQAAGFVQFDWSYFSLDPFAADDAGYLIGGTFVLLSSNSGDSGGPVNFSVSLGESFGFRVETQDNQNEPGILTVSNFSAPVPSAIPEPGTAAMLFLSLPVAGGLVARRWLNRRKVTV